MGINIAIDGPSGAGKSTIARKAAAELGFIYVDTGAIYRSVTYYCLKNGVDMSDPASIENALPGIKPGLGFIEGVQHVFVNGEDVSDKIRTPEVSMLTSSAVASNPRVREFLLELQRKLARENNVIMDGRDIGTVILPNADLKIFLTASPEVRAQRRYNELKEKDPYITYEQVLDDVNKRDHTDTHHEVGALKMADDAVLCDTTELTLNQSVKKVTDLIRKTVLSNGGTRA